MHATRINTDTTRILIALVLACATIWAPPAESGPAPIQADFKVAFIGDAGDPESPTSNPVAVLELIRDEGADLVLHQGDLGYSNAPGWIGAVNDVLGERFPYFFSIGNHDTGSGIPDDWTHYYGPFLRDRVRNVEGLSCVGRFDGELTDGGKGIRLACRYRGLFFVLADIFWPVGEAFQAERRASLRFLEARLACDDSVWRVCSWHIAHPSLSAAGLVTWDIGLEPYEICRRAGAVVATAHSHSYSRTKTLIDMRSGAVHPEWPDGDRLHVDDGMTFAFVSGLGGSDREQTFNCPAGSDRPHCDLWASVYGRQYGALFIEFHVDGDPRKARGYFKDIDGQIVDEFIITSGRGTDGLRPQPAFRRGDVDQDGVLGIADPLNNLAFQFVGTYDPPCLDACDFDDNGILEIADPINNLSHQFLGALPPPPPGKESCGPDPTPDDLGCESCCGETFGE